MDARECALAATAVALDILDSREARICQQLEVLDRFQRTVGSKARAARFANLVAEDDWETRIIPLDIQR